MAFYPLLLKHTIDRAVRIFPKKEIVCKEPPVIFRYTYRDFYSRICQVANMLESLGVKQGDVVATFAENNHRHLELHFAVPCMGAVFEPLTIMLPKETNIQVMNNIGKSKVLFIDEKFIPLLEEIKGELKTVETYIIMTDKKELPKTSFSSVYSYEELINNTSSSYSFPEDLSENSPALLANTSGTTGPPKGFVHSHRNIFLHAVTLCMTDGFSLCSRDVVMISMPIWYFNTWNFTYAVALIGAKMVLPSYPDGRQIGELVQEEKVTFVYGLSSWLTEWVSTWEQEGWKYDLSSIDRLFAAATPRMSFSVLHDFVKKTGIRVAAGMGFSEACPLTCCAVPRSNKWEDVEKVCRTDGLVLPLLGFKMVNEKGEEIKWDGKEVGRFGVKGPHIIDGYLGDPRATAKAFDKEGYFYSGDAGTVNEEGYVTLGERIEDLIRGETGLISPSRLEGVLGELPFVKEVAAIGVPQGDFEKPIVCVTLREEYKEKIRAEDLKKEFEGKIPWAPPEVIIIKEMPRGPTGKYAKATLKKQIT